MNVMGHLQPSRSIAIGGSLSSESLRAGRVPMTAELGQLRKSEPFTVIDAVGPLAEM
jgi:hypothetical protein